MVRLIRQRTIAVISAQNRGKIRNIGFSIIAYTTRLVFTWQCPAFRADKKRGTSGGECYGTYSSSIPSDNKGAVYVNSCIHSDTVLAEYTYDEVDTPTVWYNYVLATAGTITETSSTATAINTNTTTESICPKGWTLPAIKQIDNLTGGVGSGGSTVYVPVFNPMLGGAYSNGTRNSSINEYGAWWSSDSYTADRRWIVYYDSSYKLLSNRGNRITSLYIRCVSEEKDVSDLTYMQDMAPSVAANLGGILSMRKICYLNPLAVY